MIGLDLSQYKIGDTVWVEGLYDATGDSYPRNSLAKIFYISPTSIEFIYDNKQFNDGMLSYNQVLFRKLTPLEKIL